MSATRNFLMAGLLFITGLFLTAMACAGLLAAAPAVIPTAVPSSPTAPATETALPVYQGVALSTSQWEERDPLSSYTITVQAPMLVGSDDPRVQAFNAEMKGIVDNAVTTFKQNVANLEPSPDSAASTFALRYNLLSRPGNIFSLKFDIQTYYSGAAHPGDVSQTVTFDLEQGQDVTLADLFRPNADYLTAISKYCIAQLKTRDIGFQGFELGATATAGNYRNWNITVDGLMITFDEYQVGPYAAGPQTVVVPYKELAQIIQPDGPLAIFAK